MGNFSKIQDKFVAFYDRYGLWLLCLVHSYFFWGLNVSVLCHLWNIIRTRPRYFSTIFYSTIYIHLWPNFGQLDQLWPTFAFWSKPSTLLMKNTSFGIIVSTTLLNVPPWHTNWSMLVLVTWFSHKSPFFFLTQVPLLGQPAGLHQRRTHPQPALLVFSFSIITKDPILIQSPRHGTTY